MILQFHFRYTPKRIESKDSDTCTMMFLAAIFTVAKKQKQSKFPSKDELINKIWYIYKMEYYSALKRKEILIQAQLDDP